MLTRDRINQVLEDSGLGDKYKCRNGWKTKVQEFIKGAK